VPFETVALLLVVCVSPGKPYIMGTKCPHNYGIFLVPEENSL